MKLFSKHRGTEHFFIILGVIVLAIIMLIVGNSIVLSHQRRQIRSTTAIFTPKRTWSITGDSCEVVGMGRNNTHDRVAVMINNGLYSKESIDANRYQVFMISSSEDTLINSPECTLYSYGNGYILIMFEDVTAFNDQQYDIIIRDNMNTTVFDETDFKKHNDVTFNKYNQIELILNLGVDSPSVPVLASIPDDEKQPIRPENIYADIVMAGNFNGICKSLDDKAALMRSSYQNMESYYQRIKEVNTYVPYLIRKDKLLSTMNPELAYSGIFDQEMIGMGAQTDSTFGSMFGNDDAASQTTPGNATTTDGSTEVTEASADKTAESVNEVQDGVYYVHFETLFPGQTYFDYHGMHPSDEFLSKVTDMSYDEYVAWRNKQSNSYDDKMSHKLSDIDGFLGSTRYLVNGTEINLNSAENSSQSELIGRINSFENALNSYMNYKYEYCKLFDDLYDLEQDKLSRIPYITMSNNFEIFIY